MPNTTDPNIVAQACLEKVRDLHIPHTSSTCSDYVSISLGLATTVPLKDDSLTNFLKTADKALYEAKNLGKNQVVIAGEVEHGHALAGDGIGLRSKKSTTKQPW
jgi:diguanylate cyclase (GGDEF)-like protein